jgi:hydrogenase-4 component B
VAHAREVTSGMLTGMGLLAALCLLLGVFPTTVISVLDAIPQQLLGRGLPSATAHGWLWLTPISAEVASYSAPLVLAAIALVFVVGWPLLHRRTRLRRGYPWDCGFGALSNRMQYTATAFAQPIRRIFAPAWQLREEVQIERDSRAPVLTREVRHHLHALDWSWTKVYEPFGRLVLLTARRIGVIQTGNIRTYLLYSFLTLLLLLLVIS